MNKTVKRLAGLLLFLCFACLLFIAAIHWTYAIHDNRGSGADTNRALDVHAEEQTEATVEYEEARYLPVLMYHHLDEQPERFQSRTLTPARFEEDMQYLTNLGFETVDTEDLALFLEGKKQLPARPIMVTIDDGYTSVYEITFPVLRSLQQKAVATVIGASVGRQTNLFDNTPINPHFSWEEAREMKESGFVDIQSHSFDLHHPGTSPGTGRGAAPLPLESEEEYIERFTTDTLNNHHYIEDNLPHHRVALYAYPYGIYNEWSETVLKQLGYVATLTIESGVNEIKDGFHLLKRVNMAEYESSSDAFADILRMIGAEEIVPDADESNPSLHGS